MRILFIPCAGGVVAHLLPLMALEARLDRSRHQAAFLVPLYLHELLRSQGLNVLDIDYRREQAFRNEMLACGRFRPDIIVDDLSLTALLTTKVFKRPRLTIRRTGTFPGGIPRHHTYRHSYHGEEFLFDTYYRDSERTFGIRAPKNLTEVCAADMNIVPGIRSIEVLPTALRDDPTYAFAGSLIVPDSQVPTREDRLQQVIQFFDRNQRRAVVYLTLGTTLNPTDQIREIAQCVLDSGFALISTVDLPDLVPAYREVFFYARFLPMDAVCSNVRLMIHHCGCGTYHYAIRHRVPSICIGSGCYDRDDIAYRLDELGIAKYIPQDELALLKTFQATFLNCVDSAGQWYRTAKQSLELLRDEDERTSAAFDFEGALEKALSLNSRDVPSTSPSSNRLGKARAGR